MIFLALLASIAAAGLALTMLFLAHGRPEDDRGGPRADMVRYSGGAAIAALLCGAMNILETAGGGDTAAAIGNATNLVAVGLIWAGARRLNRRRAIGAVSTAAGAVLMLGFTFLIPLDDATLLKTAGLTVFGALSALELARRPLGALSGARVLSWTLGVYAAYNLSRLIVVGVAGVGPLIGRGPVSAETTAAVSAVAIVLVSVSVVRLGPHRAAAPAPGPPAPAGGGLRRAAARMRATRQRVRATLVRVPEIDLIRAAHSAERADMILRAVSAALEDSLEDAACGMPGRDTVFAIAPAASDTAELERDVRVAFARRMPEIDYADVPDLTFEHRLVADVDELSLLMDARRPRPRQEQRED